MEILSAIAEKLPGAPKVKPGEHLGTLRTLKVHRRLPVAYPNGGTAPACENSRRRVLPVLVAIVSEKTGYPGRRRSIQEMDLEADLGIDSIKRVEILSAVAEEAAERAEE